MIDEAAAQFDEVVADMDVKLTRVLYRQEQEYLKGYSIYVR